jgi:hypothetical protein
MSLRDLLTKRPSGEYRVEILGIHTALDGSKIVTAQVVEKYQARNVASRFCVTKSLVQKLVKQQQNEENLLSKKRGKPRFNHLANAEVEVRAGSVSLLR